VPHFRSYAEEARFWDTHDVTEHSREMSSARVKVSPRLSHGVTIRLTPQTLARLRSQAAQRGLGPTTLARMWIMERLRESSRPTGKTVNR